MFPRSIALPIATMFFVLVSVGACTTTAIEAPDDAAAPDAPPAPVRDAGAPIDEPELDAGKKADADDGKCHPRSAAGYTGVPYLPANPNSNGACTDGQIGAYAECLYGNKASCQDIDGDGFVCRDCIEPLGVDTWGPFAPLPGTDASRLNSAGCAALVNGDTTANGCGKAFMDYEGCLDFTCLDECPASYSACIAEATPGVCATFTAAIKAACPKDAHECYIRASDKGPQDVVKRVIRRFCGSL